MPDEPNTPVEGAGDSELPSGEPMGGGEPAAPAVDAPAHEPEAPPSDDPAEPSGDDPTTAPEPETDKPFDWDSVAWDEWNGSAEDFPEDYRRPFERAYAALNARVVKAQDEAAQWQRLFHSMANGEDDPRLSEYTLRAERAETALKTLQTQYEEATKALDAQVEASTKQYMAWFGDKYGEALRASKGAKDRLLALYNADDSIETLDQVVDVALLGQVATDKMLQALKEGVPLKYAKELALAAQPVVKPPPAPEPPPTPKPKPPSPGADDVVGGSVDAIRHVARSRPAARTMEDLVNVAAERLARGLK